MKTSPEGRGLIEAFEGLFLRTYRDSVNVLTIGYGHTNLAGVPPKITAGMTITEDQADSILSDDLAAVEKNVAKCISVSLQQCEFDALVSFDFNTGDLRKSSIDDKINAGDKAGAMKTLLLYDHAGGKVLSGLTRRRSAEKLMFEGKVQPALNLAGYHAKNATPMAKAERPIHPHPDIPPIEPKPVPQAAAPGGFFNALLNFIISLKRK